jgi:hypothetical protein
MQFCIYVQDILLIYYKACIVLDIGQSILIILIFSQGDKTLDHTIALNLRSILQLLFNRVYLYVYYVGQAYK